MTLSRYESAAVCLARGVKEGLAQDKKCSIEAFILGCGGSVR